MPRELYHESNGGKRPERQSHSHSAVKLHDVVNTSVLDPIAHSGLDLSICSLHTLTVASGSGVVAQQETDTERLSATAALLFAAGERPTAREIRALAARSGNFVVSFDPTEGEDDHDHDHTGRWLEILSNGLAFDLVGLAPGQPAALPPRAHAFGLADDPAVELLEAVTLRPGPHLADGAGTIPVVRQLAWLAAQLAELARIRIVAWPAARIWNGPQHFRDIVLRWSEGGVFPGFGLAALAPMPDGGMQSEGMALLIGQELRLEPELARDRTAGAKIGLRLLDWLVEHGPVAEPGSIAGPDGKPLRLVPSPNGRFVRVWTG